jgi:hypothetical protein
MEFKEKTMQNTPNYLKDMQAFIESVNYGDINLSVKRIDRKTVEITTVSEDTLRYVDNREALNDLDRLLTKLIEGRFSGDVNIRLQMKDGNVNLVGIFNTKKARY